MRRTTSPGETLQQRLREPAFVDRRYIRARKAGLAGEERDLAALRTPVG